jgi:hypothetical protein
MDNERKEKRDIFMKQKRRIIFLYIILVFILAYFFGNSPIGRFFTSKETVGKIGYLFCICIVAFFLLEYLKKHTHLYQMLGNLNISDSVDHFQHTFQIEKSDMVVLAIILLVGAVLRFGGINWGITSIFQPDENNLLNDTIGMAMAKYPYHGVFKYPNQGVSKLAAVTMMIYAAINGVQLDENTIMCYFIYRGIVALFSTLTIVTAFLIGNYMQKHLGVIVAVLVAFFPEYVCFAKQVTGDSTGFFFITLLLLGSLMYMERKTCFWIVFMSLSTACATMEKWHGAVGCFYIALVVIVTRKEFKVIFKEGCNAFFSYIAGMFLIAPNMLWDVKDAIGGIFYMYEYDSDGFTPYGELMARYIMNLKYYMGVLGILMLLVGIGYLLRKHSKEYLILFLGIFKLLALCFLNRGFPRWGLEFYFSVLLIMSIGIYTVLSQHTKILKYAGGIALCLIAICFLSGSILTYLVAVRSEQDTRLLQEVFCEENGILREESVFDFYTGFDPGGIRDGRGYDGRNKLFTALGDEGGELFLYVDDMKYAVDNIGYKDSRQTRLLKECCPFVASFKGEVPDIFGVPTRSIEGSWLEIRLIGQNVEKTVKVLNGAYTGPEIEIYDVSGLPVYSD